MRSLEANSEAIMTRYVRLVGVALVGMALLAIAAIFAAHPLILVRGSLLETLIVLIICAAVGGLAGLVSSPIVLLCLRLKDLRIAVPVVFGVSLAVVVLYVRAGSDFLLRALDAPGPAFCSVCASSVAVGVLLPNRYRVYRAGHCPDCNYDLRGGTGQYCPECGWKRLLSGPGNVS
jgi:DNA-directed RNA polymerase subunit RPC12/RpoP